MQLAFDFGSLSGDVAFARGRTTKKATVVHGRDLCRGPDERPFRGRPREDAITSSTGGEFVKIEIGLLVTHLAVRKICAFTLLPWEGIEFAKQVQIRIHHLETGGKPESSMTT